MILFFSDNRIILDALSAYLAEKPWEYEFACSPGSGLAKEIRIKESVAELKKYSLIVSAHCKQIFPPELVEAVTCVNLHPGFNPDTRGWYPQSFALAHGKKIGFTVHLMNREIDAGEIIFRREVETFVTDTSRSLYDRVVRAEIESFESWLPSLVDGTFESLKPEHEGTYHSKSDFEALCEIDMNETGTFRDFYNRLRALTFDPYRNAYFCEDGEKIFIKLVVNE
jgi:methionyl-tRNA formyltransferase